MRLAYLLTGTIATLMSACESPTRPSTGRILWHVDGAGSGTPAFDDRAAYFVSDHDVRTDATTLANECPWADYGRGMDLSCLVLN